MQSGGGRAVGGPFTANEQALLELLCQGEAPSRALAREQLRSAHWGGPEFDDCDCFLIAVPRLPRTARIRHGGGPFSTLDVSREGDGLGQIDLWVVDGYLHSVNYMPFDDEDHRSLPDPADVHLELLG